MSMSELSLDLYRWELEAFKKGAELALQIDGDNVVVTGRPEAMHRALPLGDLHWVQIDGYIRALVHDPIPHRGRQMVNAVWSQLKRRRNASKL